jgi:hypothetical protein
VATVLITIKLYHIINLTPLIPLSLKGEGEENKRGANAPLRHPIKLEISERCKCG